MLVLTISSLAACTSNDNTEENNECVICDSYNPGEGGDIPEKEVCKGDNGNAFLGSIDTTIEYNAYLEIQRTVTTCN